MRTRSHFSPRFRIISCYGIAPIAQGTVHKFGTPTEPLGSGKEPFSLLDQTVLSRISYQSVIFLFLSTRQQAAHTNAIIAMKPKPETTLPHPPFLAGASSVAAEV